MSPLNVRKTGGDHGIEELAKLIESEGVLQNLAVHALPEGESSEFFVVAGGRRLRALQLLAKEGRIASDYSAPCLIVNHDRAVQISLTENSGREPMHPADEFEAFRALIEAGQSVEDVAARFGVTPVVVQRRLKLANVAPTFLERYRAGDLGLEHLMALAVTDDQARQERVWNSLDTYGRRDPYRIREALTTDELPGDHRLARYVGLKAYEKAGGIVRRDLFSTGDESALLDRELVTKLVNEKLGKQAKKLQGEGAAWVEVVPEADYAFLSSFSRVGIARRLPTAEEQSELEALDTREGNLQEQLDGLSEEDENRADAIERELEAIADQRDVLDERLAVSEPEQQALAGAIVSVGADGKVRIERNLLKPEDAKRCAREAKVSAAGAADEKSQEHSAALTRRLSAHRTVALQAELVQQPLIAAVGLTHRLALTTLYSGGSSHDSPVRIKPISGDLQRYAEDLAGSPATETLEGHRTSLRGRLPKDPDALLPYLLKLSESELLATLAYCVAVTLDGVQSGEGPSVLDALAKATKLDMKRWWSVTGASYLASITKGQILEVVKEAVSPDAAAALSDLKKSALVEAAERQLAGTGWLPGVLRSTH